MLLLLAASSVAGCVPGLLGRGGGPVAEVERDGIIYWAASQFLTTEPVRIRTVIGARNERDRAVEVATVACMVYVRLFGVPEREGLPVWDEEVRMGARRGRGGWVRREEGECRRGGEPVTIAPGDSTWLTISVVAPGGMGDTIPPGRYYFTALVSLLGRRLEFEAGAGEIPARRVSAGMETGDGGGR